MTSSGEILYGKKAVSDHYGFSVRTLDSMCNSGLPFYLIGRNYLFYASEIDAYIKNNCKVKLPCIKH